jgi:hypothetical protein
MKTSSKIATAIVIALLIIIAVLGWKFRKSSPDSFTINATRSSSSSGGDRYYEGSVTFENGVAIKGFQNYKTNPGSPNEKGVYIHTSYECELDNGQWINTADRTTCNKGLLGGGWLEPTKEGVDQQINNEELKSKDKCQRFDMCYEIIK